ncbi:enoyl-CoA hydratase/isomerase family protein [Nitratireductor soli]|uniref:enoyl-CoA hydratase/isomerase family protein n=1 Tax=Nitratireductor soli TaxID=1670619 RepID=UPI00065E3204|nr:enoyl-CoA hydratase/isomerase family protein [Nitratireductor soli]
MGSVQFSVTGNVATVTLDRPDAMNAIDPETEIALLDCWRRIDGDGDIRAAVLTGAGAKAFSAGADLKKTMPPAESYAAKAFGPGDHSFVSGLATDKPLICAINGYALGGGLELALACDIRLAAPHARFGLPEVRVGTIPGAGGTQRLPRMVGASDAMLMLLTGDMIDAAEALRLGLISRIVPAEDLVAEAQALARRIADNAPLSVRAIKRLVKEGGALPLDEAMRLERLVWGLLRDTDDRIEGRRAFQEKRAPHYVGR